MCSWSGARSGPSGHLDGHGGRGIHRENADGSGRVILGIARTHDASKQLHMAPSWHLKDLEGEGVLDVSRLRFIWTQGCGITMNVQEGP